jgi:hypothetical protein
MVDFQPIEIVFSLLCLYRRGMILPERAIRQKFREKCLCLLSDGGKQEKQPVYKLSFWKRLCQAASLLDEDSQPCPTLLADEWVCWSSRKQISWLLHAWTLMPANDRQRRTRARMLRQLMDNTSLEGFGQKELAGLQALGILTGNHLSRLGLAFFTGSPSEQDMKDEAGAWILSGCQLIVPFPPKWGLLWELEKYLEPKKPEKPDGCLRYSLQAAALRQAAQQGPGLPDILEAGLGRPAPAETMQKLAAAPVINLIPGPVLEFTDPQELKQLRQSASLRRHLDHLLSPRHVAIDTFQAPRLLKQLHQRGLISSGELSKVPLACLSMRDLNSGLTKSERAYLFSLLLMDNSIQKTISAPPGLPAKLCNGLDDALIAAAAQRASLVLKKIFPSKDWIPGETPAAFSPEGLLEVLQGLVDRNEAIDILYQASGRHAPEVRHISPLLVENRGGRYYLVAYCHNRRANRTFRLDRMQLVVK